MSFLDGILGNKKIQELALGQLKNVFNENREMIVVTLDANGELDIKMFAPGEAAVVIKKTTEEFNHDLEFNQNDGLYKSVAGSLTIYTAKEIIKSNGNIKDTGSGAATE